MSLIARKVDGPAVAPISPGREIGAYEAMWLEPGATFKTIADRFAVDPTAMPSDFVSPGQATDCLRQVRERFAAAGIKQYGIRINHAGEYPRKLRDARHPVELLYYRGNWELTETRCVAVVGSREPSEDGADLARQIAHGLVKHDITVVSGLAKGIDTAAHLGAMEAGGRTIAVVGTPLGAVYPRENELLQERIARDFLLITQVPALRYAKQNPNQNRLFFPERNVTMSALTEATIIVEAGETSGTLIQARAALHQKRKLFILDSAFRRPDLTWPTRFEKQGAIRVRSFKELMTHLDG
ncbi:DNA-processing protein DprA [Bosea sp. RCC_152_1]|uniref:DNA-processing protein DprA n=1 Tax=Bosea sp. RCC_152_1 TaxID=3239228 RepID=UPI003524D048